MNKAKELYWAQHKVFFIATLALFPEKLEGHEVNQLFYSPYFIGSNESTIEIELEDYRKANLLEYDKPGALYKITSINTDKATNELTRYLKTWQLDGLEILSASKPPDIEYQKELLSGAIVDAHANHQNQPRITLEDIYGNRNDYNYQPPFWELVISYGLIDGKVKIKGIGYDRRADGLYDDNVQPFVEYEILNKDLMELDERQAAQMPEPADSTVIVTGQQQRESAARDASVFMQGQYVCIAVDGDKIYRIAKLGSDTSHYKFMKYLLATENNDIDITINDINDLEDLKAARSLTELARYCGFAKPFKKAFFITSQKDKVHFKSFARLDDGQVQAIKELSANLEVKKP